jgi:DMSO/TMAO reductase YedYZ molybdopterin-dependent catalytic subunit
MLSLVNKGLKANKMWNRKILSSFILVIIILTFAGSLLSCSQPASPTGASSSTSQPASTRITPISSSSNATDLSFLMGDDPALVDNSKLPVTPVDQLHRTGTVPLWDFDQYRLTVDGLVDNPLSLTYDDVIQLPSVTEVVLLICPGAFVDNAEWTGVPVKTLLDAAVLQSGATEVTISEGEYYHKSFLLKDAEADGFFLAYKVDGQVLPREHGYPLRLVVKDEFGSYWVKWVSHIEVS